MGELNKENEKEIGLNSLYYCCQVIKETFTISQSFKSYNRVSESCTVRVANKTFTQRGERAFSRAIKDALVYLVNTYSAFTDIKEKMNAEIEAENKVKPCIETKFEIVKAKLSLS